MFGSTVEDLLLREGIIDRFVATVDNLPRNHVPEKIRPVAALATEFAVEGDEPIILSEENFKRYDELVAQVAAADLDDVADMYRRYYPLFQVLRATWLSERLLQRSPHRGHRSDAGNTATDRADRANSAERLV